MRAPLLCALCALCAADQQLTLFPSSSPAKCTDGSPAGYYYEPGAQKTKWVLWIQGGGLCQSNADCANRAKSALGSSKYWVKSRTGSQHQSTDPAQNPDFHDWQHVYLSYCSGDAVGHGELVAAPPERQRKHYRRHNLRADQVRSAAAPRALSDRWPWARALPHRFATRLMFPRRVHRRGYSQNGSTRTTRTRTRRSRRR